MSESKNEKKNENGNEECFKKKTTQPNSRQQHKAPYRSSTKQGNRAPGGELQVAHKLKCVPLVNEKIR